MRREAARDGHVVPPMLGQGDGAPRVDGLTPHLLQAHQTHTVSGFLGHMVRHSGNIDDHIPSMSVNISQMERF